jgi:hypothetical protein
MGTTLRLDCGLPVSYYFGHTAPQVLIRLGGYSTGTENFRTERLDEYVGDWAIV